MSYNISFNDYPLVLKYTIGVGPKWVGEIPLNRNKKHLYLRSNYLIKR